MYGIHNQPELSSAMKFHNRLQELKQLKQIEDLSRESFFFLRVTGRRRIGKTELIREWTRKLSTPILYFYVTRQNEASLLVEFQNVLSLSFPQYKSIEFRNLSQFIQTILDLHVRENIVTIFDEFQEFQWVAPQAFSVFQKELDLRQRELKGMLIVIGSLQSMMSKLFDDAKQPLFGRLNATLHCQSFSPTALEQLFRSNNIKVNERLDYYTVFHGVPYYYKLIDDYQLWGKPIETIIKTLILDRNSILIDEGKQLLLGEFGKNYSAWFSILKVIASGHTRLSEIVNKSGVPMVNINRYLNELMDYYQLVVRRQPFGAKKSGKISRYYISDRFIEMWFRWVYHNQSLLEIGAVDRINEFIKLDFASYQGRVFEEYCKELLIEQNQTSDQAFDEIGSWWDRGNTEIDIITVNHQKRGLHFYECKLQEKRYSARDLQQKATQFIKSVPKLKSYKKYYSCLAADNWESLHQA